MPRYRLILFRDGCMVGRQEFAADDFTSALYISAAIFQGCGDDCSSYELWEGANRIDAPVPINESTLTQTRQAHVIAAEESILASRWAIANSTPLLARLNFLKAARAH